MSQTTSTALSTAMPGRDSAALRATNTSHPTLASSRGGVPDRRVLPHRNPLAANVKSVLVVGGAGYIGSVLVRHLLAEGYRVRVLDSLLFGKKPLQDLLPQPRFQLIEADVYRPETLFQATEGVDAVVHLAAVVGDPACDLDPEAARRTNYAATQLVAEACLKFGVPRMVFASTCSVYGSNDQVVDEQSRPNPVSLYAATKIASERALLKLRSPKFHPTILRLGTAFGWSPRPRFDLVINLLTARAFFEKKIVIYNARQLRPFVHVSDISRAFRLVLQCPIQEVSGHIFNVGSSSMNYSLRELGERIHRLQPALEREYRRNSDVRSYRVCCDKIRVRLGFRCHMTLDEGIHEVHSALHDGLVSDYALPIYHNHKYLAKKKPARAGSPYVVEPETLESPADGSAARGAASGA